MYSKTSLAADQLSAPSLSPRGKKILFTVLGVIGAAAVALGVWSAVGPDKYTASASGCVSFYIAGSTGGSFVHYCGADAKSFCRTAYTHDDKISLLGRPKCEAAGLTAAKVVAAP
ncbi:MAG TPA: hypothetical protein VGG75_20535 [Trebonia sp.]|jgi:hypothetical protein